MARSALPTALAILAIGVPSIGAAEPVKCKFSGVCTAVYYDIHDGDKKKTSIDSKGDYTIESLTPTEKWIVKGKLDTNTCDGMVDFRVPGKPNPPPSALKVTFVVGATAGKGPLGPLPPASTDPNTFGLGVFTDPTGKLGGGYPLNMWVLENATLPGCIPVA